jgi:hypothetical protein
LVQDGTRQAKNIKTADIVDGIYRSTTINESEIRYGKKKKWLNATI